MSKRVKAVRWQLDCSARFYPVVNTRRRQSLFCISASLGEDVDRERLRRAVNKAALHYPTICASIKRGFFWYELEKNISPIEVFPLGKSILLPIDETKTGGHCFRISCGGKEVRLEMNHALTDGTGALQFFKAILDCYLDPGFQPEDKSDGIYTEDAFEKYYDKEARSQLKELAGITPHRHVGTLLKDGFEVDSITLSAAELVGAARAYGATLTEYLAGMLALAIEEVSLPKKPVVMMIPVNLRAIFTSKTVRNFTLFVRVVITPNSLDSPDLYIAEAKRQLRSCVTKEKLGAQLSTTVRGVKLISWVPLFIKRALIMLGRRLMRSRQTIILSNLGRVELPTELNAQSIGFRMNVSVNNVQNLGIVTLGDSCTLSCTRAIEEDTLSKRFFELINSDVEKVRDSERI